MYNEKDLARLSYRDLQVLAAQHRVPGNIKKHAMIKVILAARSGNDTEVTRLLNELQQTRKKKIKKIKNERKIKKSIIDHTNYQENHYYAHQPQSSYHCASNLPIATEDEIINRENEHSGVSSYGDIHEYLIRVQRDYHFNVNNDNECIGSPPIVDLRMNEQQTIVHHALPIDLYHATNILLTSSESNYQTNANDKLSYHHFLNPNDALQAPLLLKKMLQAPVGTNLKDIAGPDGVYRIYSKNDFATSNFVDDSDTLTADSESNPNDDIDNTNDNYYLLNNDKNSINNIEQNLIDDNGINELNTINHNYLNDNDQYSMSYQSSEVQKNCQKWIQGNNTVLNNSNITIDRDNTESLRAIHYDHENSSQQHIINAHINQLQYQQLHNYSTMSSYNSNNNHGSIESSNSTSYHANYNNQCDNNDSTFMNNNFDNNHGDIYYNNNNKNDYHLQSNNYVHNSEIINNIYPNIHTITSQQCNHDNNKINNSNYTVDNITELNNTGIINNSERYNSNEYYCRHHQDVYSQNCQMDINSENNHDPLLFNNQQVKYNSQEFCDIQRNQSKNYDHLKLYYPHWKQSYIASSSMNINLENLLNIRKCNESNHVKSDETLSVFCYSEPIVTPKQLITNEYICTQQKRFFAEKRKNLLINNNSSLIYSDTAQGLKMANDSIDDINLDLIDRSGIMSNDNIMSIEKNINRDNLNDPLRDVWAINTQTKSME